MQKNQPDARDYYAIQTYLVKDQSQLATVESFIESSAIPALNAKGVDAVGVFTEMESEQIRAITMLIPYPSIQTFAADAVDGPLHTDGTVAENADYLNAPADAPAYERIESTLLLAFERMPRINVPENKSRIFELRRYESHSELKSKKKIEMFNSAEIDIFLECGLSPVFFGEAIIGEKIPNLTYMLVFDDVEDQEQTWQTFINSPKWIELKERDEYQNTVSTITKTMLVPTSYSQI